MKYNIDDFKIERLPDEQIESKNVYVNKVFNKKSKETFYNYILRLRVRGKTQNEARDNIKLLIAIVKIYNKTNKDELIEILGKTK